MSHICVGELGYHWFRQWLVAFSAPSHYLNWCWLIFNSTLRNKLQGNFNRHSNIFFEKKCIWKCRLQFPAQFFRKRCVKKAVTAFSGFQWFCAARNDLVAHFDIIQNVLRDHFVSTFSTSRSNCPPCTSTSHHTPSHKGNFLHFAYNLVSCATCHVVFRCVAEAKKTMLLEHLWHRL